MIAGCRGSCENRPLKLVAEHSWLLEFRELDEESANARVRATFHRLVAAPPPGFVAAIPGARTLLVQGTERLESATLARLEREPPEATSLSSGLAPRTPVHHTIVVTPDGEDFALVLGETGLSERAFWEAFCSAPLRAGFLGFSPGFGYLYGLPVRLHLPRHQTPRAFVRPGSVALAGSYAGIYPSATPGGWNVVGTSSVTLFRPEADPPTLLSPGDHVRFKLAGR